MPQAALIPLLIQIILPIILGLISRALTPKPKSPAQRPTGRKHVIRASIEPHQVDYGTTMVSGPLILAESTGASNQFLHIVVPVAAHELESIDSIWIGDTEVLPSQLDGGGNVTSGPYTNHVRIKKLLGTDAQTADAALVEEVPNWTTDHRGRGIAYVYLRLRWNQDVFSTGIPNVRAVVRGRKVWDPRLDPGDPSVRAFSNNAALCQLDYLMSAFGFEVPLAEIHESSWSAAANVSDEQVSVTTQAEDFVANASTDRLHLVGPRMWAAGDVVRVSTTDTLPSPLVAATDYYVIPVSSDIIQVAATLANARARTAIDLTTIGSGVHTVTRNSQLRYTVDGSFQVDQKPASILEDLLTASAGAMVYQQGTFRGYAGAATTPTNTLDESDLRGKISVTPRPSISEAFNAIRGTFVDADDEKAPFSLTDFPPITNATFETEDNNERVFNEIELPYTTNKIRAQRLGNLFLLRARQGITVEFPAKMTKFELATWDVVTLTIAHMGWTDKEFRILEWEMTEGGGVNLTLQEEASAVYDFGPGDEITIDPAPDTNLPNPFTVDVPTDLALVSGTAALFLKADGTVASRIKVTWTQVPDQFVISGGKIEVQFKKSADTLWEDSSSTAGDQTMTLVSPVEDGIAYDVRIRAVNTLLVKSDWATVTNHVVIGKTEAPPDVTTFVVATLADGTRKFEWTVASLPADVRAGGGYHIRFASGASLTWATGTKLHDGLLISSPFETNELAAGQYTFGIKTIDSSGNESTNDIQITATLGDPRLKNVLIQRVEHALLWPGTLTSCFLAEENVLEAVFSGTPAADWDSLPGTWDALAATWRGIVASATPLRYETPVMDLGVDVTFTPLVSAEVVGALTTEMRTHTSAEGSDLSAEPYIATAQVVSERYVQIRISVAGTTPVAITMTTLLDGEVIIEDFEDIDTATEAGAFFNLIAPGHFEVGTDGNMASIAQAQITAIQSVSVPHTWTLISKTATVGGNPAAEFKIFDDTGTLVNAVVDISIKGPKL